MKRLKLLRTVLPIVMLVILGVGILPADLRFAARQETTSTLINPPLSVTFTPQLVEVVGGFEQPLFVTHAGDGSGRLFVVEKPGRIIIVTNGVRISPPFLNIQNLVLSTGYEQGLLGLAFHPEYRNNGLFFVNYTNLNGDTVVARYQVSADDPGQADPASAATLLTIDQPFANHNGGMLVFGPDKYLYIGLGDGGSAGDPLGAGQSLTTLLGKILRIDVNQTTGDQNYGIPEGNPFVTNGGGLPEIWSHGWRNPWRFSFDRANGDLYVADVGQNAWEEVHIERAGSPGGLNYGWNIMEGTHCFQPPSGCNQEGLQQPFAEYSHSQGISITGGYVYRGTSFPDMQGTYFYGDFGSTRVWAARETEPDVWSVSELMRTGFPISSFGEDETGELYVVDFSGRVYQLTDAGS